MISKEIAQVINTLLNERKSLVNLDFEVPHDYSSVRECILQLELSKELEILQELLSDLESFDENFKKRCVFRESDTEFSIPFHVMPESITNQLYWEIAKLVFAPESMKEILEIVAPSIKNHLWADIQFKTSIDNMDGQHHSSEATIELLDNIDNFQEHNATLEQFTHYVMAEGILLDGQQIAKFSLKQQANLQNLIISSYPELAKKLYTHNTCLRSLSLDILTLNNKGITPKSAIEQLIVGLNMGGERMTGQPFAGKLAIEALARFFSYYNALPNSTKEQLRLLEDNNISLGKIIDHAIAKGECVETIAIYLTNILQKNSNKALLISPPEMTNDTLRELNQKYGYKHPLDTKKDSLNIPAFPVQLTQETLRRINPKEHEELISLILNFPPAFYDTLWENITLSNPKFDLDNIAEIIKAGFFNPEQRLALLNAITKHYDRFNLKDSILFWAMKTNDPLFLQSTVKLYPENQLLPLLMLSDQLGNSVLQYAVDNPELLKIMLEALPVEQRLEAVSKCNNTGITLVLEVAKNAELLRMVLECLPEGERLKAVSIADANNDTCLHWAASSLESLKILLALYPPEGRQEAVKLKDKYGVTVIHRAANHINCLNILKGLFTQEQWVDEVMLANSYGLTVLHESYTPETFKMILTSLPEDKRLDAVKIVDNNGNTALHYATSDNAFLEEILTYFPEEQRLEVLKIANNNDANALIHRFTSDPEILKAMLELYPQDQQLDVANQVDINRNTALHRAAAYYESLKIILDLYPENQKLEAARKLNTVGYSVLHYAVQDPLSLSLILGLYPQDDRLNAINAINKHGNTVLVLAANFPESLKVILSLLPETQRLELLKTTKNNKSMLSILIENQIMVLTADEGFQDSFVPDYLSFRGFLAQQQEFNVNNQGFFSQGNNAIQLSAVLDECNSFTDIKNQLLSYANYNPDKAITREIEKLSKFTDTEYSNSLSKEKML